MKQSEPQEVTLTELAARWRDAVDRAAGADKPLITTLQSFAGDEAFLMLSLAHARDCGVDILIAAESDGTFY